MSTHVIAQNDTYSSSLQIRTLASVDGTVWIEVSPNHTSMQTRQGAPFTAIRLVVALDGSGIYMLDAFHSVVAAEGVVASTLAELGHLMDMMVPSSAYKFCPGLFNYNDIQAAVRFDSRNVRTWSFPVTRTDSTKCKILHELSKNATMEERAAAMVQCRECKLLQRQCTVLKANAEQRKGEEKQLRTASSSKVKWMHLSPASQTERLANVRQDRRILKRSLACHENLDLHLSEDQSDELHSACKALQQDQLELFEDVVAEAGTNSNVLREAWEQDHNHTEFLQDQDRNVDGSHGNRWSMITYRMALAVYTRSSSAYQALKSFGILKLPSVRSLQHYTSGHNDPPGWCEEHIIEMLQQYTNLKKECLLQGKAQPKSDGIMIFDEVKVVSRVLWNSSSQEVYGLSMTPDQFTSLQDVFQELRNDADMQRTEYVLQFLWRDMMSSTDIFGPYYTSPKSMDAKFIYACVLDSFRLFHSYGLMLSALVCEGASTNLTLLKAMVGMRAAFGNSSTNSSDRYAVPASTDHPFWPGHTLYFVICPSHMLKNLINALYSSRPGGTKAFVRDSIPIGWKLIIEMYERECQRQRGGVPRDIPKLRKNYIWHDPWTKLNVFPAKIMQQDKVLTELATHCLSLTSDAELDAVEATRQYLLACNSLFEPGTLSHAHVKTSSSQPLDDIVIPAS